jgi:hypothetical protein
MVSGREYRVEHPEFATLGRNLTTLHFTDDRGRLELIRLSQLESVNRVQGSSGVIATARFLESRTSAIASCCRKTSASHRPPAGSAWGSCR